MMQSRKVHNQPLIFTQTQLQQIDNYLLHLADHIAAPMVMLSDVSGQLILYRGRLSTKQSTGLAALAAGSLAAGVEIGHFLGLRNSFQSQLLEGKLASLYILKIDAELLLIVAFTPQTTLGMVRLFALQTYQELSAVVKEAIKMREENDKSLESLSQGFNDALSQQLDDLFAESSGLS
jgi:predicted regulator of Ras-like GTPase activity (Roadblock/LC7/MglB family)